MSSPLVSVIIPTFNWSSVLPFSIGSVLGQTFRDFELLVVGDACTDDSAAVVSRMADARVRWINLAAHVGHQTGPNNAGLREAHGRLVAYLGHDDLWLPHHLDCLIPAVERGGDLVFGMTAMIRPDGRILSAPTRARYAPGMWVPPSSVVHRRQAVEAAGGWRFTRETPVDPEADLWRRVYEAGLTIESVPRLSALKFPALWRKNVYGERPHHEQAAWSKRLAERDLEAELLGRMFSESAGQSGSARQLLRSLVGVTADRIRARVLRHAPGLYLLAKNELRKRDREFKGLSPRK